jgi:hypothetical protein
MVEGLAGVLIIRAITGEAMPAAAEVDHLVNMTMYGIARP